ncbi:MAG TPA: TonB-dependent receptor [Sphingobium sp.]
MLMRSKLYCLGSAALGLVLSAPAYAQVADADASDIVVTAQKRAERLEDVPIAITSIGGDTLAGSNVSVSSQLPQLVPSLRIDYSGAFAQPTIRGVGSATSGNGLAPNVATYIDGFYVPSALSNDFQLASVTNVSVLKGPQGTLFGRNATGGAIMVTTRDPSFTPTGQVSASYSRFNHYSINGYVSTGLTDTLAMDVAGIYEKGDGFVTNLVNGDKKWAGFEKWLVRSKLLFEPTDNVKFTLTYQHNHMHDPNPQIGSLHQGLGVGALVPGTIVATRRGEVAESFKSDFFLDVDSLYLKSEFDLGFATLTSYSQYREQSTNQRADYDHSPTPIFDYSFFYQQRSISQEFNLTSPASRRFTWVVGAYYFNDNDRQSDFLISLQGGPFFQGYQTQQKTDSVALFADGTYQLGESLFLTAGVRYNSETRVARYLTQSAAVGIPGSDRNRATFNSLTPRAVLRYEIAPRTNVYASYTRGFKSGAFNPSGQNVAQPVKPETIDAFEVGFKTASSMLRLNASAFYYSYRDLQIASYVNSSSLLQNAANSRIWGGDIDAVYYATPHLQLKAAAAYTHATFSSFPNAPLYVQCLNFAACGAQGFGLFVPTPDNSTGRTLPRAPRFTASIGAQYDMPIGASTLTFNADMYHTSKVWFDPVEQFGQDAYEIVNLRATYSFPGDKVQIAVFGTNILDKTYLNQVLPAALSIGQTYGEPASYGVSGTFKF